MEIKKFQSMIAWAQLTPLIFTFQLFVIWTQENCFRLHQFHPRLCIVSQLLVQQLMEMLSRGGLNLPKQKMLFNISLGIIMHKLITKVLVKYDELACSILPGTTTTFLCLATLLCDNVYFLKIIMTYERDIAWCPRTGRRTWDEQWVWDMTMRNG